MADWISGCSVAIGPTVVIVEASCFRSFWRYSKFDESPTSRCLAMRSASRESPSARSRSIMATLNDLVKLSLSATASKSKAR
jgi:hypothetical protein